MKKMKAALLICSQAYTGSALDRVTALAGNCIMKTGLSDKTAPVD